MFATSSPLMSIHQTSEVHFYCSCLKVKSEGRCRSQRKSVLIVAYWPWPVRVIKKKADNPCQICTYMALEVGVRDATWLYKAVQQANGGTI